MTDVLRGRILAADDQADILNALTLLLSDEGYEVICARSPREALDRIESADFDLAIVDLNYTRDTTSGQEGLDLLERLTSIDPTLPVLVVTAWSSVSGAVDAMRRGARDYIEKPWNDERLVVTVRTQIELRRALRQSQRLTEANSRLRGVQPILIGDSPAIVEVRRTIDRVARSEAAVLITGEHGTGKEVVAMCLHAASDRHARPMVTMNAGGLAEGLAESELFGHVRGAFTGAVSDRRGKFEVADGGTIFLDEIGDMSLKTQAKVLRVLQEQTMEAVGGTARIRVDARVLAATNKDLQTEIRHGHFREDLYFRLNVIPIFVPPLRERQEDVPLLADHFMAEFAREYGRRPKAFEPDAVAVLQEYSWPGNVRELRNVIERLVIMVPGDTIGAPDLGFLDQTGLVRPTAPAPDGQRPTLHELRERFERDLILRTLAEQQGNMSRTAEVLGVERSNLYRKMRTFGIAPSRRPDEETA
jgi:DNA-binding NtrC family response regulator